MGPPDEPRDLGRTSGDDSDDDHSWMVRIGELEERQVDDLVAGVTPAGCDDLDAVAAFAARLRREVQASPPPPMSADLRSRVARGWPSRPRRRALAGVVVAGSLAVGSMSAAAAQGVLPDPVQRAVARAAAVVGWHVPDPEDGSTERPGAPDAEEDGSTPPSAPDGQPGDRTTPGTDQPTGADGPGTSSGPPASTPSGSVPGTPATPAEPDAPGEPATPATPATPAVPGRGSNAEGSRSRPAQAGDRGVSERRSADAGPDVSG